MKTYNLCYAFLALAFIGCTKSGSNDDSSDNLTKGNARYTVVLQDSETLSTLGLKQGGDVLVGDDSTIAPFSSVKEPTVSYESQGKWSHYSKQVNCEGKVTLFDFKEGSNIQFQVFNDLGNCNLQVNAILHTDHKIYLAYEIAVTHKLTYNYVRVFDLSTSGEDFRDIALFKKPLGLAFVNERLFVLTQDTLFTGKNAFSVIDGNTDTVLYSDLLHSDVRQIFEGPENTVIVSYDDLHMTINGETLSLTTTKYGENTKPHFKESQSLQLDSSGKLYYTMPGGEYSNYPLISAIYDFHENTAVLYAYENFLTEAQRDFEFEIENTTMVSYDEENDLLLIGYKKKGNQSRGGLIRIKTTPNPVLIDNTNLEGIPIKIFF